MNRKNTTLLVTMTIAVFAVGGALAQDASDEGADRDRGGERDRGMSERGQRGQMGPERSIRMLTNRLELDETQAQQVRNIYLAAEPDSESLREQGRTNRMAMRDLNSEDADYEATKQSLSTEREGIRATAKELRDRIRTDIDGVLTAEQREKFAALSERGQERGRRDRRRGNRKPEAL